MSDGTEIGTHKLIDLSAQLSRISALGSNGIFLIVDTSSTNTIEVWKTDGSVAGTIKIKTIANALSLVDFAQYYQLVSTNSLVYFVVNEAINGQELWRTDGTSAGTHNVNNINTGTASSEPRELVNANGILYFSANNGIGRRLWKTDGTELGTVIVRDQLLDVGREPEDIFADGSTVYFSAVNNDGFSREPWISDGTSAGTVLLKDLAVIPDPIASSFPSHFQKIGNSVFFFSYEGTFKTDGTTVGTVLAGLPMSLSYPVEEFDGKFYFKTNTATEGKEPAFTDGTAIGTELLADINVGSTDSDPDDFTAIGNSLFFSADDGISGRELWVLQKINRILTLQQAASGDASITVEAKINTNFDLVNYYAICHTAGSLITPTAINIKNGTVDGVLAALSSVLLLNSDPSSVSPVSLTCDSLPNASTEYDVYSVFEDAANPNEFSEVFTATSSKIRTTPQVSALTLVSSDTNSAEYTAQISLASQSEGVKVYYVCDENMVAPTAQNIIAGEISSGVDAHYSSSRTISASSIGSSTSVNKTLPCNILDSGVAYHIYAIVDDLGLDGNSFDETPTNASFATQGQINSSSLLSTSENSIGFRLSQFATTFANIDIYAVCYEGSLSNPPSASDVKAGRVDATTAATDSVQILGALSSGQHSLTCDGLNPSASHEVYAVFEDPANPNNFSEVKKVDPGYWRTAPQVFSIVSTLSGTSSFDVTIALNNAAQTNGSRIYWVCDDSALVPSAINVIERRIANGVFADSNGSEYVISPISTNTVLTVTCNNLTSGNSYSFYAVAEDRGSQYSLIDSFQTQPIMTSLSTISKIDSITQIGMTETSINFEIDSISTVFENINAYLICVENGVSISPTALDIKAGHVDASNVATASGQLLGADAAQSSFPLSCESGALQSASFYDIYSVIEDADNIGVFSEVFQSTSTEWRTVPIISELETEVIENQSISVKVKVRSSASSTNIRLHMICDQTEQIPTSENVISGLINSTTAAAMVEKMDLNAFTNLQSDQQYTFTCVPTEPNKAYHLFLLAEDLTFTGESFQTNPSSTMGELESDDLCVPIKISSSNTVVLICL